MHTIATLNKIAAVGLERFPDDYVISDNVNLAEGILVRSHDMLDMNFSENLLAIARAGAGVNNIPVARCADEGIVVFNTPGANANAVKELVLSGIFLAARNLPAALEWTKTLKNNVASEVEKGKAQFAGNEIRGKTLGIIGLGYIGVGVANTTEKLGMNVIGYDPFISVKAAHELSRKIPLVNALDEMLPKCDYISIHVPALESTKHMIGEKQFAMMKKETCFLNFSRDSLVDDDALLAAINSGIIKKYITDFPNDKLIGNNGIVCLPHLGASTDEAEELCAIMAADQLIEYLENGNIINSVNYPNCNMGPLEHSAAARRICILNRNIAGMLTRITGIFANMNVNISDMVNKSKGDYSYTVLDIDTDVNHDELRKQLQFDGIIAVRIL